MPIPGFTNSGSFSGASSAATGPQTGGGFSIDKSGVPGWVLAVGAVAAAVVVFLLNRKG